MNPLRHRRALLQLEREELRLRCADGRWIWVRQTVVVLRRYADGSAEMVGFLADVTASASGGTVVKVRWRNGAIDGAEIER